MMAAASVKSKAELEQIALAMMMMAGGEGTSATEGVKTRSSRRASEEPVSGNRRNNNGNHDQPVSPENEDEELFNEDAPDGSPVSDTDQIIKQEVPEESLICIVNPLALQSPTSPYSPAESQDSTNSGNGKGQVYKNGNYICSSRRIFKPEFKQLVLDAFSNDPECVGNQRATARKFGIHRRQVQKWLQQLATGELAFKDSQKDNDDECGAGVTSSSKLVVSSAGNQTRSKAKRRSTAGVASVVSGRPIQQQRASDPPGGRATRSSVRNRGKSMPLKGGSKSTAHFVPTIVHPNSTATSVITPASLVNLSKGGRSSSGRGGGNSTAVSGYNEGYNENGNGSNGGSNMFMNMSSLLASAAAAGNLTLPLSLENPRNFSPRENSPINNNGRGSPAHSAGGSSGGSGSHTTTLQNALMLVDELNFLYPYSDFSLLRKALLKEEVSLEKLAIPLIRNKEFRVNGNGISCELSQGLRDLRRAAAISPSPSKSSSAEYNTQQTLDIIRQQQEYLKLLQQCGIGNSSTGELSSGLNLSDLSSNNGRLPAWFNPFAAAAAAGLPIPSTSTKFGGNGLNGNGGDNTRRKISPSSDADNHRFASPRAPPSLNSGKAKTVAAALAATRVQSSSTQQIGGMGRSFQNNQNGRLSQNQRPAQRRKGNNSRQARSTPQIDDDIDPTSMLEVVTSIPSPSSSPRTNSNHYGYSSNHHRGSSSSSNDYHNQGMDLSTTAPSGSQVTTTTTTTTRLISKAMNKEYSFLSELGLVRKSPEEDSSGNTSNGYGGHTASLENFVQNIMPSRQKSPQAASSSTSSSSPPATDTTDSEKTKTMVIDAFNFDSEISGDARAVARKFGLNVRVVMKWLKEGPVRSSPPQSNEAYDGGFSTDNNNLPTRINGGVAEDEDSNDYLQTQNLHKAMLNESNNNSPGSGATVSVNKRKNSKPNQICDFPEDEGGLNGALDMVVPIKKRRVSSPSPTPQDA